MTVAATLIVGPDEHDRLKAFTRVASSDLAPLGVVHFAIVGRPSGTCALRASATDGHRLARSDFDPGAEGEPGFYGGHVGYWCVDARDLAKALGSRPPKTKGWTVVEFAHDDDGSFAHVQTRDDATTSLPHLDRPPFPADRVWPDVDHEHGVMAAHVDYRLLGDLFATAPDPDAGVRLVQPGVVIEGGTTTDHPYVVGYSSHPHAPAVAVDAHGREFGLVMPTRGSDPTPEVEDDPEDEGCVLCTVVAQWGTTCREHAEGGNHG